MLYARLSIADATELRTAFEKSGTLPAAAECRAARILYAGLGQLPTTPAVLILRATFYD